MVVDRFWDLTGGLRRPDEFHRRSVAAIQQLEQLSGDGELEAAADVTDTLALGASPGMGPADQHLSGADRPDPRKLQQPGGDGDTRPRQVVARANVA
jgi:hypothetical protein